MSQSTSDQAISVRNLTKIFHTRAGQVHAVQNLNLTIGRGEVVALLGPNGAGKTTFLDMVLGMVSPDSGTLEVFGQPPRTVVSAGRVAALQQTGGLLADLSVEETVTMIASLYTSHMPVGEALERAGAASFSSRKISKCSGGQQQRVKFALALLPEPDLLILDEPTSGMDPQARTAFWETMHAEAREGRTVVFATHYLQEAEQFAQRVVLMNHGRIAHDGTLDEFRAASTHHTVSFTWLDEVAPQLPHVASLQRTGTRFTAHTSDADALARTLLCHTTAQELEISRGGLDEAFAALLDAQPSSPSAHITYTV